MESTRKLRRELAYEMAKLHGLQESVDVASDDSSAKALATQIRTQAGVCLDLLDHYQSSVPGRMWSDAERRCRPLREDLRRTEKLFRVTSGEWEGRTERISYAHRPNDWGWDDVYALVGDPGPTETDRLEKQDADLSSDVALSRFYVEAHNRQDLEGLMELIGDDVEFKRAGDAPLHGRAAVRQQYEREWAEHKSMIINIDQMFEADGKVAIEIHVDTGSPSCVHYDGVVVHDWNDEGRLVRYHLYVDEVTSAEECRYG